MRFHVVSLPHTATTKNFNWCAYTEKVRKFSTMMTQRGHDVFLYAADANDAECKELIPCVETPETNDVTEPQWTLEYFRPMNRKAIVGIGARIEPQDIICLIAGLCQKPIANCFPDNPVVEFGIGYSGTFADYRVFESYAWMHAVYAEQQGGAMASDGHVYDCVVPNYFEVDQFPAGKENKGYLLYVGRIVARKGIEIVNEVAKRSQMPLIVAGQGKWSGVGEHVGVVDAEHRAVLMGNAHCVLTPSLYCEPFCGVAVEAQMCGAPVITTDWGAFTETVHDGRTGFRCHTIPEFVDAVGKVQNLDRAAIRTRALSLYSTEAIGPKYERYFERVLGLYGGSAGDFYGKIQNP